MKIPFLDLKRQYETIKPEVDGAIKRVIDRHLFILGEESSTFEKDFAGYLQTDHVCGVNSGTDALILSLRALGIGEGDEVITPALSFIATTLAITEVGATPVFVDVDRDTYEIDVKEVEAKITSKTKAILPVHLYGAPCQIDKIVEIAEKNNLAIIEDACQAHGASLDGKKVGTFGDLGTYSFYPGKNLGAYGDGGAISTNQKELYGKLIMLRNYGQRVKYHHDTIGINSRLDEIQAAILDAKLTHLDNWNARRLAIAEQYNKRLKLRTQKIIPNAISCYHIFIVESEQRDNLIKYLAENDVQAMIHYPVPIHLQKCYDYLGYKAGDFPHAEEIAKRVVSLPIYAEMTDDEVLYIINLINKHEGDKQTQNKQRNFYV